MINGAHVVINSTKHNEDKKFFKDVLKLSFIDIGQDRLLFGLPPSEAAFHPGKNDVHELYLMCDDVKAFVAKMKEKGIVCSKISELSWGSLTQVTMPSGSKLSVYEPKHARPHEKKKSKSPKSKGK